MINARKNFIGIAESDFAFAGMNVYVHVVERHNYIENEHGKTTFHHRVAVRLRNSYAYGLVHYRSAVDYNCLKVLVMLRKRPFTCISVYPVTAAEAFVEINKLVRDVVGINLKYSVFKPSYRIENRLSVYDLSERHLRIGKYEPAYGLRDKALFCFRFL